MFGHPLPDADTRFLAPLPEAPFKGYFKVLLSQALKPPTPDEQGYGTCTSTVYTGLCLSASSPCSWESPQGNVCCGKHCAASACTLSFIHSKEAALVYRSGFVPCTPEVYDLWFRGHAGFTAETNKVPIPRASAQALCPHHARWPGSPSLMWALLRSGKQTST